MRHSDHTAEVTQAEHDVSKFLEYKGHFGSIEYSEDDGVFFGRLQLIRDLVTYESTNAEGLEAAFRDAVDAYLDHEKSCTANHLRAV